MSSIHLTTVISNNDSQYLSSDALFLIFFPFKNPVQIQTAFAYKNTKIGPQMPYQGRKQEDSSSLRKGDR